MKLQQHHLDLHSKVKSKKFLKKFSLFSQEIFKKRISEKEIFYNARIPTTLTKEERNVIEQAYAGLLWSKQFYHYIVKDWINGDPEQVLENSKKIPKKYKKLQKILFNIFR